MKTQNKSSEMLNEQNVLDQQALHLNKIMSYQQKNRQFKGANLKDADISIKDVEGTLVVPNINQILHRIKKKKLEKGFDEDDIDILVGSNRALMKQALKEVQ